MSKFAALADLEEGELEAAAEEQQVILSWANYWGMEDKIWTRVLLDGCSSSSPAALYETTLHADVAKRTNRNCQQQMF